MLWIVCSISFMINVPRTYMTFLRSGKQLQWPNAQCCRLIMRYTFVSISAVQVKVSCVEPCSILVKRLKVLIVLTLPNTLVDCPTSVSCLLWSPLYTLIQVCEPCHSFLRSACRVAPELRQVPMPWGVRRCTTVSLSCHFLSVNVHVCSLHWCE